MSHFFCKLNFMEHPVDFTMQEFMNRIVQFSFLKKPFWDRKGDRGMYALI